MRRIAYLSYSTGQHDARTMRMARSAIEAGYVVSVYARWEPGLAVRETGPGYEIVRVPADETWLLPGIGGAARRRWRSGDLPTGRRSRARDRLTIFPLRPMGWARALDDVAGPADLWHGMWAGSLPALDRLRARHGGRTIYDSRDIYMRSRGFERLGPLRTPFAMLERRWARRADRIITVNDAYARVLAEGFRRRRAAGDPEHASEVHAPVPAAGPAAPRAGRRTGQHGSCSTRVVCSATVASNRGWTRSWPSRGRSSRSWAWEGRQNPVRALAASAPYRDKVRFVDPVRPDELLDWTASADVSLMAIQPTSLNHRLTTPQKLWESIAARCPGRRERRARDGRGRAPRWRRRRPRRPRPGSITRHPRGPRRPRGRPPRAARRYLRAAAERYAWEAQVDTLMAIYADLLGPDGEANP